MQRNVETMEYIQAVGDTGERGAPERLPKKSGEGTTMRHQQVRFMIVTGGYTLKEPRYPPRVKGKHVTEVPTYHNRLVQCCTTVLFGV